MTSVKFTARADSEGSAPDPAETPAPPGGADAARAPSAILDAGARAGMGSGGRRNDASLLEELLGERSELGEVASRHGMSLKRLAAWSQRRRVVETLAALIRLTEDRADLALARARGEAAHALRRLATDAAETDLARKAGVDLLKLPRWTPRPSAEVGKPAAGAVEGGSSAEHEAVRALLESAGAASDPARGEEGGR